MKIRLWLIVGVGLVACTNPPSSEPPVPPNVLVINYDPQLRKTDAGWFYKGALFSGYMVEREKNGRVVYKLPIVKGRENGVARGWYNTGEKLLERYFLNGKKEGAYTEWWPNGQYRYRFQFRNDQYEGLQRVYFPSGCQRQENHYQAGNEEGTQRTWNDAGELVSNYTIRHGKLYGVVAVKNCIPTIH